VCGGWFTCILYIKSFDTFFTAEGVNGKALLTLEKSDLKDIGINTLGRRLEVYEEIKKLTSKLQEKASTKSEGHSDIIFTCVVGTRKLA